MLDTCPGCATPGLPHRHAGMNTATAHMVIALLSAIGVAVGYQIGGEIGTGCLVFTLCAVVILTLYTLFARQYRQYRQ